tara:strand:- start:229 stop:492 length:264 start_codon:yes stop_codon:yes gene_type:complete
MKAHEILDEKLVWAKAGNRAVRKYRCGSGSRKGRVVAQAAACFSPIDIKKRLSMKRTKAKIGSKMSRKAQKTKRINPISRRIRSLNK